MNNALEAKGYLQSHPAMPPTYNCLISLQFYNKNDRYDKSKFWKKNVLQLFKISDNYSSNMIIENFVIDS